MGEMWNANRRLAGTDEPYLHATDEAYLLVLLRRTAWIRSALSLSQKLHLRQVLQIDQANRLAFGIYHDQIVDVPFVENLQRLDREGFV
jgi:hypothetical protein